MAKKFVYTNAKNGRVLYQTVEPNYVSRDNVDIKMKQKTGTDPRLNPHLVNCQITVVKDR